MLLIATLLFIATFVGGCADGIARERRQIDADRARMRAWQPGLSEPDDTVTP
jgi:hypothetical protein